MKISEIAEILGAESLTGEEYYDLDIKSACGSDMMSDVLAFHKEEGMLLTGLVNLQVVRTAQMMDIRCIVFVRGKRPDDSILELAKDNDITVLCTKDRLFGACGKLYCAGMPE
jgi:predicted transcriptional regulator